MTKIDLKKFRENFGIKRQKQADILGISLQTLNSWEYRRKFIPKMKMKHVEYVFENYSNSMQDSILENENYKNNTISERLKYMLEKNGLTNYHFCKKVNISQSTISRILNKNSKPSSRNLQVICNYFNVSEEWFLTGNEKQFTTKGVKSSIELEIQKIVETKLYTTQKELQNLNTKLDLVLETLSKLILEREEKKILKGIKRA